MHKLQACRPKYSATFPTASLEFWEISIATGKSRTTGQRFNIAVAFERSQREGPALAESTFHHFADYNWDPRRGSPDFVTEKPVFTLPDSRRAMASVHRYVRNVALWLGGKLQS